MIEKSFFVAVLVVALSGAGCDAPTGRSTSDPEGTNAELLQAVMDAEQRALEATIPPAAIEFPDLSEWTRSEPRPLPPEDVGFTVGYNHPIGISVTLYQFSRGHSAIPDDLESGLVPEELDQARDGINQVKQLGYWKEARETDQGIVNLGTSAKQAVWCRHAVAVEGEGNLISDTYVWAHANQLFKVRATSHVSELETEMLMGELLSAFGNACVSNQESD